MNQDIPNGSQSDSRFESVLAEIQQAEEQSRTIDPRHYLDRFPDLAEPLRDYFRDREWFARVADVLAPPAMHTGMPPCLELGPGSLFSGYTVVEEIGHGGRGVVYRVSDSELKRPLAVKVLQPQLRDEPDAMRRFEEEAQVTAQLQHPGIVPVHAIGRLADGRPYFAMKLVEGRDLGTLLAERPAPAHELPRYLGIFEKVCQAVAYGHGRSVINRDLKPKNIMVGAFAEVQVMDWGFAKVLFRNGASQEALGAKTEVAAPGGQDTIRTVRTEATGLSSRDGLIMGTIAYMSPEQAKGQVEQLDTRADVFGLGAILCQVLTGLPPYAGVPAWKLHQMAEAGDLADAFARLDGCGADAELISLAKDCLAPERERRPRDAGAVVERVATFLAGVEERLRRAELEKAAAEARAEEARAKVRAERRARRLTLGLAVALLGVVVALAVGGLWLQRQLAEEARQRAVLRQELATALAQAARFRQAGHFNEARELLEQAQQRLGADGPTDLREQVDQALADNGLAKRLDAARQRLLTLLEGEKWDFAGADNEYAAALKEAGLGQKGEDAKVVAARVRTSAVRAEIVAALDDWASIAGDGRRREWLLAVARAADPDPERDRLRQPELWRKKAALAQLAGEAPAVNYSPQLVTALGRALSHIGGDAIPLLRKAQAHHPDDFWLNYQLGWELHMAKQWDEAIAYYRAALARRPEGLVHLNLGAALYDKGQRDEAIGHYEKALRINPNFATAHYNLGNALRAKGRPDEAIAHYEKALRIKPKYANAHNNLGNALRAKGRLDEAIAHYKEALRINPKNAKAHNNLGNTLRAKGEVDEAVGHYKQALRINPKYAMAHNNLGNALRAKGRLEEAIAHYEEALRINCKNADAHNNLGNALRAKGRVEDAIAHYKEALRINPKHANAHSNLGNALRAKGRLDEAIGHYKEALQIDPKDAKAHYNLGLALYDMGRLDEAIGHYKDALRINPKYAMAHNNLGNALRANGQFDEAISHYEEALRINPKIAEAHSNLGLALRAKGRLDEAVSNCEEALRLEPKNAAAHLNLGVALGAKGRLDEAIGHYKEALRINPKYAMAHYNLGLALRAKGHLDEAIGHYEEALRINPKDAKGHNNLGNALRARRRLDEAIGHYKEALRINPKQVVAHNNLGNALRAKGDLDEAVVHYKEALRINPKNAKAHFNLGLTLNAMGRLEDAIGHYEQAIRIDPKDAKAHTNLGAILCLKGRLDQAIGHYEKALRLEPKNAAAHTNLAVALYDKGRLDQAIGLFEKGLRLEPKNAAAHTTLGAALYHKGRLDEAIGHYEQALRINPKNAMAHNNFGVALLGKGRLNQAIRHYEEALRINPKLAMAHTNLGVALRDNGRPDEAISHYKEALRLEPKDAGVHLNLGAVLYDKGRLDEALGHLEEAIRINPKDAEVRTNLGLFLYDKGRVEDAIGHFKEVIRIHPKFPRAYGALGQALLALGRFVEARDATRRCVRMLPEGHPLRAHGTQQLQRCERMLVLKGRLSAIVSGKEKPAGSAQRVEFGALCQLTKHYAAAVRLYADAFAADVKQADNMQSANRYKAACCAVLAATALKPNDKEQPRLRRRALDWLRADLALWKKRSEASNAKGRAEAQRALWGWQNNPGLASVRDKKGLAKLPDTERKGWEKLWAEVEALRKQIRQTK
jgi:tetratricopeptide (TPR) repeat protein